MNKILAPARQDWPALCRRPAENAEDLGQLVREVFDGVAREGDAAVAAYARRFGGREPLDYQLSAARAAELAARTPDDLQAAIRLAAGTISRFHAAQREAVQRLETLPGVACWRESRPIERVGIYIPGGTAPLFSTVLMLALPARLAGCKEIVLCSPPDTAGSLHPAVLYAASLAGVDRIFAVGGIQAIAAMAGGTALVPRVDKIFGPGNQYVTAAKTYAQSRGVAIDLPAGPSELLVIADASAVPAFVAADLLSQAEHGPDSQVMLLTTDEPLLDAVLAELTKQLALLPRRDIAAEALRNSRAILLPSLEDCFAFSNDYAPEHLIVAVEAAAGWTDKISSAGSVFLGNYSCESAGDYASGTNHTLPTNGFARGYSGVSLDSFLKKITFQQLSREGLQRIGPAIELMAEAEGLQAHREAVRLRLTS